MIGSHAIPWLPVLTTGAVALVTVTVRCLALLVGLLATLSKAAQGDRPKIFRDFARAASGRRTEVRRLRLARTDRYSLGNLALGPGAVLSIDEAATCEPTLAEQIQLR